MTWNSLKQILGQEPIDRPSILKGLTAVSVKKQMRNACEQLHVKCLVDLDDLSGNSTDSALVSD